MPVSAGRDAGPLVRGIAVTHPDRVMPIGQRMAAMTSAFIASAAVSGNTVTRSCKV